MVSWQDESRVVKMKRGDEKHVGVIESIVALAHRDPPAQVKIPTRALEWEGIARDIRQGGGGGPVCFGNVLPK